MQFNGVEVPSSGEKITLSGTKLVVPDNPIIPFIEGDGTGRDIWKASQLVFALKNDLAASASNDRVLILNAPDNLRGVPLFHNGLPEALQFFQKEKSIKQVDIVSFQSLHAANDPIELNSAGDQLTLRASEAVDRFDRINGTDCLDATSVQSNSLRLQWKPCSAPTDVFFFSSGKMNRFTRN